jgi:hypothetical protein
MAGAAEDGELPEWLKAGEDATGDGAHVIDTTGWFESVLGDAVSEPTNEELEEFPEDEIDPTVLPAIPSLAEAHPSPCRHARRRPLAGSRPTSPAPPQRHPAAAAHAASSHQQHGRRRRRTRPRRATSRSTRSRGEPGSPGWSPPPTDGARVAARRRRVRRGSRSGRFGAVTDAGRLSHRTAHGTTSWAGKQAGTSA